MSKPIAPIANWSAIPMTNCALVTLLLDLAAEEDRHSNSELLDQLGRGDRHDFQIETRYRRKDGRIIWVHNTVSQIPGTDESSSFIITIAKDITSPQKCRR